MQGRGGTGRAAAAAAASSKSPSGQQYPPVLECDYDLNPTVLYQAIEARQWDYALSLFDDDDDNTDDKKKKIKKKVSMKFDDSDDDADSDDDSNNIAEDELFEKYASSTWVVRKETNGKLRWRLLPLHACCVFGAPLRLVELLLTDYPEAAQCKDDQGMTPLHLAFRNQASWDVIDELLTSFPMAVFVTDRKGRTPLQCGAAAAAAAAASASAASTSGGFGGGSTTTGMSTFGGKSATSNYTNTASHLNGITGGNSAVGLLAKSALGVGGGGGGGGGLLSLTAPPGPACYSDGGGLVLGDASKFQNVSDPSFYGRSSFRSIVSVLELYSQIAVSGERKRAEQEARSLANASITQLQESHVKSLTALKQQWQVETERLMTKTENEKRSLQRQIQELEDELKQGQGRSQSRSQQQSLVDEDIVKELYDRYSNSVHELEEIRTILDRRRSRSINSDNGMSRSVGDKGDSVDDYDGDKAFLQSFKDFMNMNSSKNSNNNNSNEQRNEHSPQHQQSSVHQRQDHDEQQNQSGNRNGNDDGHVVVAVEEEEKKVDYSMGLY